MDRHVKVYTSAVSSACNFFRKNIRDAIAAMCNTLVKVCAFIRRV